MLMMITLRDRNTTEAQRAQNRRILGKVFKKMPVWMLFLYWCLMIIPGFFICMFAYGITYVMPRGDFWLDTKQALHHIRRC